MSFHFAIPQNTCWSNLCRTDLPSLFIKLKWSITLDYCCITHGGIHESGRKSWSGMSSTFIIYFIVITIHCHHHLPSSPFTVIISFTVTTIHSHHHFHHQHLLNCFGSVLPVHHEARSSQKHRILCFQTPADDYHDEETVIDQWLQSAFTLCESSWWVVKLHRVNFEVKFWGPDNLWQV